ncbi:MAG: DUF4288 domain-containing protein [Chitinophagaceae bacterium]|jgi:hypothetical protein|nr:MAG: DUF4288 domain-containing protein [Chitinophagaceae bacterium]
MNWYLAKIVFRILTEEESEMGLFEEKLRLINGKNLQEALQNAAVWGEKDASEFINDSGQRIVWEFIAISEMSHLPELTDGIELNSHLSEMPAREFISLQRDKQLKLYSEELYSAIETIF